MLKEMDITQLSELNDTHGIIYEANRTFFHPLGMELQIKDGKLIIAQGENGGETFFRELDRKKIMAFRKFQMGIHKERMDNLHFLIQVNSIKENPEEHHITSGKK